MDRIRFGVPGALAVLFVVGALIVGVAITGSRPSATPTAGGSPTGHSPLSPAAPSAGGSRASLAPASGPYSTIGPSPTAGASPTSGPPSFSRVFLIVLENRSYEQVVDGGEMPYLRSLIEKGGLATDYNAVARPSQPNYIALFSGDTQGINDNGNHDIDAPSLADQLDAAGKAWSVVAENVPDGCFTGASSSGGEDGPGTYVRRHEPAISFVSISRSPSRCGRIMPLRGFKPAGADLQLIVPNLCHDAHDCGLSEADSFLHEIVPRIRSSDGWDDSAVLFITLDEGDKIGSNRVPLVIVSPLVAAGTVSARAYTHYSLLRTIQDAWGLGCLANSCDASNLEDLFRAP